MDMAIKLNENPLPPYCCSDMNLPLPKRHFWRIIMLLIIILRIV
jgi:hypothetical protein